MTLKFLFTLMIRDIFMAVSNQGYPNVFHFFSELFFFFLNDSYFSSHNEWAHYYNRKVEKLTPSLTLMFAICLNSLDSSHWVFQVIKQIGYQFEHFHMLYLTIPFKAIA